jgi:hypothetical protein
MFLAIVIKRYEDDQGRHRAVEPLAFATGDCGEIVCAKMHWVDPALAKRAIE